MSFRGRFLALGCTTDTRPLPAQLLALRRNRRQLKIGNRAIGAHADELRPRTETPCRENKLHRYISHPIHLFVFKGKVVCRHAVRSHVSCQFQADAGIEPGFKMVM